MGPGGKWVEVQIRTERMDEIAEKGYAAHWKYKQKGKYKEGNLEEWINLNPKLFWIFLWIILATESLMSP